MFRMPGVLRGRNNQSPGNGRRYFASVCVYGTNNWPTGEVRARGFTRNGSFYLPFFRGQKKIRRHSAVRFLNYYKIAGCRNVAIILRGNCRGTTITQHAVVGVCRTINFPTKQIHSPHFKANINIFTVRIYYRFLKVGITLLFFVLKSFATTLTAHF